MKKVKINFSCDCVSLRGFFLIPIITQCIEATLDQEKISALCEINVLITNNKGIQAINNAYRNIDKPTDVLSFPMFALEAGKPPENWTEYLDPDTGMCPLGDMAISLERAIAQAKEYGHSVRREVGYLTIHSVLHLLGYDHMDEGPQKEQMRSREETIAATVKRMQRD